MNTKSAQDIRTEHEAKSEQLKKGYTPTNTQSYFEIDLGHRKINARKWKSKDRKNFKKALQNSDNIDSAIIESLVMNCLEDSSVVLEPKELQYVLIELRKVSISDSILFNYTCSKCEKGNEQKIQINTINTPVFKDWEIINGIEFYNIPNSKFYNDNKDDEDDAKILAFHTKSIDGDMSRTFEEVVRYYEEMDINEFDEIYEKYLEYAFNIDNIIKVVCTECENAQMFEFDEIPTFFPSSWLK